MIWGGFEVIVDVYFKGLTLEESGVAAGVARVVAEAAPFDAARRPASGVSQTHR